ncbi:hypothetical protein BGX33_007808 [Mortierella sp. NVP41]|nr:hypothetical protein BGX33_007808 [Mortierella sp. NVP41]
MTDRPEDKNGPLENCRRHAQKAVSAILFALVLVYLRRVNLQDLAVITAFKNSPGGVDWAHYLFADNPVFSSQPFLDFAQQVQAADSNIET